MFQEIYQIVKEDLGGRGFANLADLAIGEELCQTIFSAKKVAILTGFPVKSAQIGETDGPLGAVNIATAFREMGAEVTLLTDQWSHQPLLATAKGTNCPVRLLETPQDITTFLEENTPDVVVTIERPSKGKDGHFHSMRGVVIDEFVMDTDGLTHYKGGKIISIGDGGNEFGMASFNLPPEESLSIFANTKCDFPLLAGVSNWWGWGIQALISLKLGRDVLVSDQQETEMLQRLIKAGGVDGITAKCEMTVDNLTLEENLDILRRIRVVLHKNLKK
ncbi:MAG: DUF4392 domain-containing protein [Eubacteriales bacterium]